jgi:hypothetical protein
MMHTDIEVLEHGLLALPDTLTYQMAIPVAYWKAVQSAVVLVLRYTSPWRAARAGQFMVVYTRVPTGQESLPAASTASASDTTRSPARRHTTALGGRKMSSDRRVLRGTAMTAPTRGTAGRAYLDPAQEKRARTVVRSMSCCSCSA